MAALSSVCDQLDEEVVACLEALQRYLDAQVMVAELCQKGFLALARARRASNSPAPFSAQFPAEIMATAVVHMTPRSDGGSLEVEIERLVDESADRPSEPESRTKAGATIPAVAGHVPSRGPAEDSFSSMSGNVLTFEDEDGVTHVAHVQSPMTFAPSSMSTVNASMFAALVAQGTADQGKAAAAGLHAGPESMSSLKEQVVHAPRLRAPPTQNDPLKWFGVLVPPALREGQRTFERLMPVLSLLANARADVERHSERCVALRADKERLLAAS